LTFHPLFLKALIFFIESTLILLIFQKYIKKRKIKIYKKKIKGSILRINQYFTYKYRSTTQNRGVHKGEGGQFGEKKERKEQTLNLSLLQAAAAAPFPSDFFSFFLSPSR
jgi:hypothetical protein